MRKGNNPQKEKKIEITNKTHRVIIPLYIPELEAYYKESFKVFKMCINSLFKTTNKQTVITIVNNGSCIEVDNYLNELFQKKMIDEVINTQKVGKLNAVLKGIRASNEPFITITDADVLFQQNWLSETIKIFTSFKKVGVVGVAPQFKLYNNLSHNVIFDNFFSSNLKYTEVKEKKGLQKFYKSIGWNDDYNKDYLTYNLSIKKQNISALVGCGHFVATYKRCLFDNNLPFTNYSLGGTSEMLYLDLPAPQKNMWRLTTEYNFAYHMGNTVERWMLKKLDELDKEEVKTIVFPSNTQLIKKNTPFLYFVKQRLFSRLFSFKWFQQFFYRIKGLPKKVAKKY